MVEEGVEGQEGGKNEIPPLLRDKVNIFPFKFNP